MIVELGVGVLTICVGGYTLWILRARKAMLRRHVLRQRRVRKYVKEE